MSEVTLEIGGHPYTVSCEEGQESHIEMLGTMIEDKLATMQQLAPQRSQNLLFAALFLADDLHELNSNSRPSSDLEQELSTLKNQHQSSQDEKQELQLERDALLSERDSMRADHGVVKQQLADTNTKLAELAEGLEKCADELEQRVSVT